MTSVMDRVEVALGSESSLEKDKRNYQNVVKKLNRYFSKEYRSKGLSQQPSPWRVFHLVREAIRLRPKVYSNSFEFTSVATNLILNLETCVSYGVGEDTRKKALRIAIDLCKFLCPEVKEEID